jgi:hypothetical protein
MWILFRAPAGEQTAKEMYEKRVTGITADMQASGRELGCTFHRAWYAADGSAFYALAHWESADGANAFFERWNIDDEPGEEAIRLEGDVGLVPLGGEATDNAQP